MTLIQLLTAIANAIRGKTGSSSSIPAQNFPQEIAGITTGNLTDEEYDEAIDDVDDILENTTVPTGTILITENGEYDVTNYTRAIVNKQLVVLNFNDGYSIGTSVFDDFNNGAYRTATTARATTHDPIKNDNYIFTVTDSSKYAVNVIGITSNEKHYRSSSGIIDGYWYSKDSIPVTWVESNSAATPYVWVALKKLDNTAFTTEELANNASAVITITKSN